MTEVIEGVENAEEVKKLRVKTGDHYLAFVLDEKSRNKLLKLYPPKNANVVCHHITIAFKIEEKDLRYLQQIVNCKVPPEVVSYNYYDGLDLLSVTVKHQIKRLDGGKYHITHSHSDELKPVDSNKFLSNEPFNHVMQDKSNKIFAKTILKGEYRLIPYD